MITIKLKLSCTQPVSLFSFIDVHHPVAQRRKRPWRQARFCKLLCGNQTLYFPLRIKIEEEYAKNLSKLSQIPLASQEEG